MNKIALVTKWTRWLVGIEWVYQPNQVDPFGQYFVLGVYVGPFALFIRWQK